MSTRADNMKRRIPLIKILLTFLSLLFAGGCTVKHAAVPLGTIPTAKPLTLLEEEFGYNCFVDLQEDYKLCANDNRYDQLREVFNQLTKAAEADHTNWHIHLFDKPEIIEVRAVHGNYIFVWSGLLDVTESEDEIAAMLAHEMGHVLARNTEPVKFNVWSDILFETASMAASLAIIYASQGAVAISGSGWMKWIYMKAADLMPLEREYSKEDEQEAMAIALLILARSKYSPAAMLKFWRRAQDDDVFRGKVKRLNRDLSPRERVVMLEGLLPKLNGLRIEESQDGTGPGPSSLETVQEGGEATTTGKGGEKDLTDWDGYTEWAKPKAIY